VFVDVRDRIFLLLLGQPRLKDGATGRSWADVVAVVTQAITDRLHRIQVSPLKCVSARSKHLVALTWGVTFGGGHAGHPGNFTGHGPVNQAIIEELTALPELQHIAEFASCEFNAGLSAIGCSDVLL
jgi:hypothetical protein